MERGILSRRGYLRRPDGSPDTLRSVAHNPILRAACQTSARATKGLLGDPEAKQIHHLILA